MLYKIVVDNLNKATTKNSKKTIAQALIDGDILNKELEDLNTSLAFPANAFNRLNLPEGEYSSQDAIIQFVRTIGPYLSDRILYELTHKLADIETLQGINTQAFRTSTLAKTFLAYELERHSNDTTDKLPDTFLAHMKKFVLPLCQKNWPDKLERNVNTFAFFNISNSLLPSEVVTKYHRINVFEEIMKFNLDNFAPNNLSNSASKTFKIKFEYQWTEKKSKEEKEEAKNTLEGNTSNLKNSSDFPISEPSNFANMTEVFAREPKVIERVEETINIVNRRLEHTKEQNEANSNGLGIINQELSKNRLPKLAFRGFKSNLTKEEREQLGGLRRKLLNEIRANKNKQDALQEISDSLENKLPKNGNSNF